MTGEKKSICLVVASPLTIEFFFLGQIKSLTDKYKLTVITNTKDITFLDFLGVPVKVIPVVMERNVSIWRDLKALIHLTYIFLKEDFDIIHSHAPKSGLLGMTGAWLANINIRIHTFHGEVWVTRKGLWRNFLKLLDKWVAKRATHLLAVSPSERKFLEAEGVVQLGKVKVLGHGSVCGVDLERFKPNLFTRSSIRKSFNIPEKDLIILYVGRLTVDKGLLDLAQVFCRIKTSYHHVHLVIVGPDEEDISDAMTKYCGRENLYFAHFTSTPEQYMAAADIFCLPSYREGFGLVLLEAAAMGLASVGSRIYGISDAIVESKTGLLFNVGDRDDLYEKIEVLICDAKLRQVLGEQGKVRVKEFFSKDLLVSELFQYYEELALGKKK